MASLIHPRLINDVFGDPGVYADLMFERRAFLFDLGNLNCLAPRQLLKVSDVFISHAHADHFSGFDRLLRLFLGREKKVTLHGPAGIIDRVGHKLGGYTWNLLGNYSSELAFDVTELHADGHRAAARFSTRVDFRRQDVAVPTLPPNVLIEDSRLRVGAAVLDHQIPCLAFALEEKAHVNVWKNRLEALGLPVGPWLRELKMAILSDVPDETPLRISWSEDGHRKERTLPLKTLEENVVEIVPGIKIAYVVDVAYHEANARTMIELVKGADVLFIEAPFLDTDAAIAARKFHLTARQAGEWARLAGVKRLVPFHFSPRYHGRSDELWGEAQSAFIGSPVPRTSGAELADG